MAEVAALGAIAITVFAIVLVVLHRPVKPVLGALDLVANFRQVGQLERSTVLVNQVFERNAMKAQVAVM